MTNDDKKKRIALLAEYATQNKLQKMDAHIAARTRAVVPVLEDVFQSHNANAVIRSAECFGVQDVHIIEVLNRYSANMGVAKGASLWVDLHKYTSTQDCFAALRTQGYRIVATSPHTDPHRAQYTLRTLPIDQKIALVFGTEETGLSDYALQHADAFVYIPMYGFTESFNISVSAALCLYDITTRLRESGAPWQLTEDEALDVRLSWLRKAVRGSEEIEKRFFANE